MVALHVVSRFRQTNDQRANRRKLLHTMHNDVLLRQLPTLIDLPLPLIASDGAPRHLDDTLAQVGYVLLTGIVGSGRTLALHQFANQLEQAGDAATPLLLCLPSIDDSRTNPLHLLGNAMQQQAKASKSAARKPTPQPLAEQLVGWVLLVSGLEELPAERQHIWRAVLQEAPQQWPQTRLIVAASRDEPRWPGFTTLAITAPSDDLIERWMHILAPTERRAMLSAALRSGGILAPLGLRMCEVALTVLVTNTGPLPANRAELFSRAIAMLYNLDQRHDDQRQIIAGLALLAAYDERPRMIIADLVEPTGSGTLRFSPAIMRLYFAAYQVVAEQRYDLLAVLETYERREIARFCATLMLDVVPLYRALWGQGKIHAEDVLTLGWCLRERPDSPISWAVRLLGALAILARDGKPAQRSQANLLLRYNRPALDASFNALARAEAERQRVIPQLIQLLPHDLAVHYAEQLAFDQAMLDTLAWELADVLVQRPSGNAAPSTPPSGANVAGRWMYVQALSSPEQRMALVNSSEPETLNTIAESGIDDLRLLRVAASLAEDPHLPVAYRIAGLGLLAHTHQPTALSVLERACYDSDAHLRQAALAQLTSRDASRGQTALGRAASDHEAPDATRIGAIEQIAVSTTEGAQLLLTRASNDSSLPLYAQLLSVGTLNETALDALADLVRNDASPADVRAFAATRLGNYAEPAYTPLLQSLLADPASPVELIEGVCAGISAAGTIGIEPLLEVLTQIGGDTDRIIAVVGALGRLRDAASVPALGELLGAGTIARLEQAVPLEMHSLLATEALALGELPAAFALNLRDALERAPSEANQPTTVREFLLAEAERIRHAAAAALAAIGGNGAGAALLAALLDESVAGTGEPLVAALAQTGPSSAAALGHLIVNPEYPIMARWLAVQHLREHAEGEAPMHHALSQHTTDTYIRGAIAEALGKRGSITALPLLRQIADEPANDHYLRSQAISGLSLLNEPATEVALIRLLNDTNEDATLRGLAASHLPSSLSSEGRRLIRELLRRERQPDALTAGILLTLGRIRDTEALPLLLRFAQDERPEVARAALTALDDLGDGSVAPVLVRVAQNPSTDRATRLRAIGTLLTIGGEGYRPLMRSYIEDGALPLRLQAIEHLLRANTPIGDLLPLLVAPSLPQPMRLRMLNVCAAAPERPTLPFFSLRAMPRNSLNCGCGQSQQYNNTPITMLLTN